MLGDVCASRVREEGPSGSADILCHQVTALDPTILLSTISTAPGVA
jgi:hypothetical protein